MSLVNEKIQKQEKRLTLEPLYGDFLAAAFRHYESYRLGNVTGLHKALHTAVAGYSRNESCIWLALACVFFHIENGNFESAEELLGNLKQYRNYYKNNNPLVFAFYLYLSALYDMEANGKAAVKKYIRQLNDSGVESAYIDLLKGDIYFRTGDFEKCFIHLESYYEKGGRSFYFYIICSEIYGRNKMENDSYLIVAYMKWAVAQGILDNDFIYDNSYIISEIFDEYATDFIDLYNQSESDTLLYLICEKAIREQDISKEAFFNYKAAEKKQFTLYGLEEMLVRCAFIYGEEDLRIHTLNIFLSQYELDSEIMPFIFHLLLSQEQFFHLVEEFDFSPKIMQYGAYALNNGIAGRIHNSIYKYMLESITDKPTVKEKLAALIYSQLFLFNIEIDGLDDGIIHLYEEEKQKIETYEFTGAKAEIKSATGNIKPVIMNKSTKRIENISYKLSRQVENADVSILEYFISKGYDDPDLYIAASCFYLNSSDFDENYIDILSKTLENKLISRNFRMEVSAALGNILSALKRHDQALAYFNKVDASRLDERYIETMLTAFINAGDYQRTMGLIIKKREFLSDRNLLWALKRMASDHDTHAVIADPAYELIIKNWYDARLLDIVIKHYKGGNEDWFALRRSLGGINVYDMELDKKILENSLWVHDFSPDAQSVFHRFYKTAPDSPLVADYLYYACFEILAQDKRPEYELIADMEKSFDKNNDSILAYALSKVYLKFNITTFKSDGVLAAALEFMERDGIILTEFKETKDKKLITAYIEKNQPFVYKSAANKRLVLYYKIDKAKEYEKKVMKHFVFGIFMAVIPVFYNEEISYFISEEMDKGSISTAETRLVQKQVNLKPGSQDLYFQINNALIYDQMFKYDEAEKIITGLITGGPKIRGTII